MPISLDQFQAKADIRWGGDPSPRFWTRFVGSAPTGLDQFVLT